MTTSRSIVTDGSALTLEWDKISCPICMEHPHNAVLLMCNSYEKGCRCFVCDTSYRHSNCLDQLKKLTKENKDNISNSTSIAEANRHQSLTAVPLSQTSNFHGFGSATHAQGGEISVKSEDCEGTALLFSDLKCPLCRGNVLGLQVLQETRIYLNHKIRNCSLESCNFKGSYMELRQHARQAHPTLRPTDVDPSRERAWHNLEMCHEYDDVLSAIRSENPRAIVFGDYVIDTGDYMPPDFQADRSDEEWFLPHFPFASRSVRSSRNRRNRSHITLHAQRSQRHSFPRLGSFGWRNSGRGSLSQDARAPWRWHSFTRSRNGGARH